MKTLETYKLVAPSPTPWAALIPTEGESVWVDSVKATESQPINGSAAAMIDSMLAPIYTQWEYMKHYPISSRHVTRGSGIEVRLIGETAYPGLFSEYQLSEACKAVGIKLDKSEWLIYGAGNSPDRVAIHNPKTGAVATVMGMRHAWAEAAIPEDQAFLVKEVRKQGVPVCIFEDLDHRERVSNVLLEGGAATLVTTAGNPVVVWCGGVDPVSQMQKAKKLAHEMVIKAAQHLAGDKTPILSDSRKGHRLETYCIRHDQVVQLCLQGFKQVELVHVGDKEVAK